MYGKGSKSFGVVDVHCCGEPARVVLRGLPPIPGSTMQEKRVYCMKHLDHIRKVLLQEPRGYPCQNVDLVVPPCNPAAAYGIIIMEQAGIYPAMSGHNTMCVATVLLETGMVPMVEPVTDFAVDTPAGLVKVRAKCKNGKAEEITLQNVPAWLEKRDVEVDVPEVGKVTMDIAFGGMWYAIVDARSVGLEIDPAEGRKLCRTGEMIKVAARVQAPVQHPEYEYAGPDILVFIAPSPTEGCHGRNCVIMSNGELRWGVPATYTGVIDRSPCGSGTCAVMAARHARGLQNLGEDFVHESIVGTRFLGRLVATTEVAGRPAVLPEITGRCWITQYCDVVVHPDDPFPEGFTVGDIW